MLNILSFSATLSNNKYIKNKLHKERMLQPQKKYSTRSVSVCVFGAHSSNAKYLMNKTIS